MDIGMCPEKGGAIKFYDLDKMRCIVLVASILCGPAHMHFDRHIKEKQKIADSDPSLNSN